MSFRLRAPTRCAQVRAVALPPPLTETQVAAQAGIDRCARCGCCAPLRRHTADGAYAVFSCTICHRHHVRSTR